MRTVVVRTHNCQILTGGNMFFFIFFAFRSCSFFLVNARFLLLLKLPVRPKAYDRCSGPRTCSHLDRLEAIYF